MRGLYLFVAGLAVGLAIQLAIAQSPNRGVVGLNHVGIAVDDLDAALEYYTGTMGFPEAFRIEGDSGPALIYVQISRNTFLELQPTNENRPSGVSHIGIEVEDMTAVTEMFSARGADTTEPRVSGTKATLANITDLNGLRIELLELPPESLHGQAMQRWRQ